MQAPDLHAEDRGCSQWQTDSYSYYSGKAKSEQNTEGNMGGGSFCAKELIV